MNGSINDSEAKRIVVPLSRLVFEADVLAQLRDAGVTVDELVRRHQAGDWGMVDDDEQEYQNWRAANDMMVTSEFIVLVKGKARSVFITTEARTTCVTMV